MISLVNTREAAKTRTKSKSFAISAHLIKYTRPSETEVISEWREIPIHIFVLETI